MFTIKKPKFSLQRNNLPQYDPKYELDQISEVKSQEAADQNKHEEFKQIQASPSPRKKPNLPVFKGYYEPKD